MVDPVLPDTRDEVVEEVRVQGTSRLWRVNSLAWFIFGAIEVLILFRVLLRLLAANPANPFASFVYSLSNVFVGPFMNLVAQPAAGGSVLEISSLIAMAVYAVVGIGVERLLWLLFYWRSGTTTRTYARHS
jgi:uncharacterized protein YggT (Ycf19 family)